MPTPAAQAWTCPTCGNFYRIAAGRRAPALCPACQAERDETAQAPPEPSTFDQLAAAVEAGESEPPHEESAPPPPEVNEEPESAEAIVVPLQQRQKSNPLRRVVAVMGSAILLLGGWGLYGVWKQFNRSTPGDAAVWAQAKIEVADRLRAPKTAEFPKPGDIRRIRGAVPPRWSVKSVVDAKNEAGVPLRHQWFMEISFDTRLRKWEPEYIEIDDQRVYASEATEREDREYAEKRDARNREAKKERDKARARQRAEASKSDTADGRSSTLPPTTSDKGGSDPPMAYDVRR